MGPSPHLDALWTRLVDALAKNLAPNVIEQWVRPCRLLALEGDHLTIGAPNTFSRNWLIEHHSSTLQQCAQTVIGGHPRVSVVVNEVAAERTPAAGERPHTGARGRGGLAEGLNARYTFDTFVVGPSNEFAQTASQTVAGLPAKAYNPLFLYGDVGLGKTHLLQAIGHQGITSFPGTQVLYVTSEDFTNELIDSIRHDRMAKFRLRYRNIDLLLIDDIQFIAGKERTQEEFFHTFNALYESGKQIVLSSDSAPKYIPDIAERLRSRFESGLIADIQPPDFETRVAILKKKAAIDRARLPDDVAHLIARRVKSNIRELEGSLTRMIAFCAFKRCDMSVDIAQEILCKLWGEDEKAITIEHIQRAVSDAFRIRVADLKARTRTTDVTVARQIAMYLARELTHASLSEIGRAFGKDHTTVMHAVEKVGALRQEDPKLRKTIESLIQAITL